jgi:hypothetical protein
MNTFFSFNPNPRASSLVFREYLAGGVAFGLVPFVFLSGRSVEARIRNFPIPARSQQISSIFGPDGNFWFALQDSSQILHALLGGRGGILKRFTGKE